MSKVKFMPLLYELVRTYQAFESFSRPHIRTLGLTAPQFDIIATLGNTDGMCFKELGEKTLITKGTLTGVVDRLEAKALVRRVSFSSDGRKQIVQLTKSGDKLFARVFSAHMAHLQRVFANFSQKDLDNTEAVLQKLKVAFVAASMKLEEEA